MEIRALADRAVSQIAAYPAITGKERIKRFIKGGLMRQKLEPVDPFSWPNAMLGQGLLAAFEVTNDKKYLFAVTDHLKRWKAAGYPIHYVDNVINGSLAMWIEELILKGNTLYEKGTSANTGEKELSDILGDAAEGILALCRDTEKVCAAWLRNAERTDQGLLLYRAHHPEWLFADTLGMVCPFLCRYGAVKNDEELLKLGTAQLVQFMEKGMDPRSGLCYHGYDNKSDMKYGIIGWGRACGWMLKGLAESLPYIPEDREEHGRLVSAFEKLIAAISGYQRPDGGFSWQLEAMEGHRDTSAEGMIGAAAVRGINEKNNVGIDIRRLSGIVQQSVLNGIVEDASGECKGFGEYSQNYGCYPWGTGSVLEFLALSGRLIND